MAFVALPLRCLRKESPSMFEGKGNSERRVVAGALLAQVAGSKMEEHLHGSGMDSVTYTANDLT